MKGAYRFDMSTRTRSANAAVMGLGSTRRIVLGDTLLDAHYYGGRLFCPHLRQAHSRLPVAPPRSQPPAPAAGIPPVGTSGAGGAVRTAVTNPGPSWPAGNTFTMPQPASIACWISVGAWAPGLPSRRLTGQRFARSPVHGIRPGEGRLDL